MMICGVGMSEISRFTVYVFSLSLFIHSLIFLSGFPVTWMIFDTHTSGCDSTHPNSICAINGLKTVVFPVAISRILFPLHTFFTSSGIFADFSGHIFSKKSSNALFSRQSPIIVFISSLILVMPFDLGQIMPSAGISWNPTIICPSSKGMSLLCSVVNPVHVHQILNDISSSLIFIVSSKVCSISWMG